MSKYVNNKKKKYIKTKMITINISINLGKTR